MVDDDDKDFSNAQGIHPLEPPTGHGTNKGGLERRRYPRVQLHPISQFFEVEILGFGPAEIFDISLSGMALSQPKEQQIVTSGEVVTIKIHLRETQESLSILSHIVRVNAKVVAIEFVDVPLEGRRLLQEVVSDRVVGLNMSLVDPKYYHSSASFTYWFHGPMETNLYLWEEADGEKTLEKGQFDMGGLVLSYENGSFSYEKRVGHGDETDFLRPRQVLLRAHSILSQIQTNLFSLGALQRLVERQLQD